MENLEPETEPLWRTLLKAAFVVVWAVTCGLIAALYLSACKSLPPPKPKPSIGTCGACLQLWSIKLCGAYEADKETPQPAGESDAGSP